MNPSKPMVLAFDWLDCLSLRAKLSGGFAFLVCLTLIIGVVSLQSQRNAGNRVEDFLDRDNLVADLSLRSKASMLEARRAEKDFLLFQDEFGHKEARTRYATLFRNSLGEIRTDVQEIRQVARDPAMVEKT